MSIPVRVDSGVVQIQDAPLIPKGFEQLTSLGSAATLTVPAGATMALIQAQDQTVRWRDDGVSPSATVGMYITANEEYWYTGNLSVIEFIEETTSAKLNVSYYAPTVT